MMFHRKKYNFIYFHTVLQINYFQIYYLISSNLPSRHNYVRVKYPIESIRDFIGIDNQSMSNIVTWTYPIFYFR